MSESQHWPIAAAFACVCVLHAPKALKSKGCSFRQEEAFCLCIFVWVHAFTSCWLFCHNCTIRCCHPLSLDWVPELGAALWALNELHLAMSSSIETPLVAMRQTSINLCVCSSAWWPCWLYACVVEEVRRREGKKRTKTRQKWKGKSEGRKGEGGRLLRGGCIQLFSLFMVRLVNTLVLFYCRLYEPQSIVWFLGHERWPVFTKRWNLVVHSCAAH